MTRRLGGKVESIGGCCSEAGTLALSRPDIACAMLQRKRDHLQPHVQASSEPLTMITNCPSCISGLGRNQDLGLQPRHLATILAERLGGDRWQQELAGMLTTAEVIAF